MSTLEASVSQECAGAAPKVRGGGLGQEGRLLSGSASTSCGCSALDLLIDCQSQVCVGSAERCGWFPVKYECVFPSCLHFIWVIAREAEKRQGEAKTQCYIPATLYIAHRIID